MGNLNTIELSDNENSPLKVDGPFYINFSNDSNIEQSENNSFSVGQYEEVGEQKEFEYEFQNQENQLGVTS